MGASRDGLTLPGTLSRAQVKDAFDEAQATCQYQNGHIYSGGIGMANGLEFKDHEFATLAEAEAWLWDNTAKWGPVLCVRAKDDAGAVYWRIEALCAS